MLPTIVASARIKISPRQDDDDDASGACYSAGHPRSSQRQILISTELGIYSYSTIGAGIVLVAIEEDSSCHAACTLHGQVVKARGQPFDPFIPNKDGNASPSLLWSIVPRNCTFRTTDMQNYAIDK